MCELGRKNDLQKKLGELGCEIAKCDKGCAGFRGGKEEDKEAGIFPRGFVYQKDLMEKAPLVVIFVGMNPGILDSKGEEIKGYKRAKTSEERFKSVYEWWRKGETSYYERLIKFVNVMETSKKIVGIKHENIIWTEIVHCQYKRENDGQKDVFKKASQECHKNFLSLIKILKDRGLNYLIFAVGRSAESSLRRMFKPLECPKHFITIPHPSRRSPVFDKMFTDKDLTTFSDNILRDPDWNNIKPPLNCDLVFGLKK